MTEKTTAITYSDYATDANSVAERLRRVKADSIKAASNVWEIYNQSQEPDKVAYDQQLDGIYSQGDHFKHSAQEYMGQIMSIVRSPLGLQDKIFLVKNIVSKIEEEQRRFVAKCSEKQARLNDMEILANNLRERLQENGIPENAITQIIAKLNLAKNSDQTIASFDESAIQKELQEIKGAQDAVSFEDQDSTTDSTVQNESGFGTSVISSDRYKTGSQDQPESFSANEEKQDQAHISNPITTLETAAVNDSPSEYTKGMAVSAHLNDQERRRLL